MVTLTKDEAKCLATHLELYILQEIRDDENYDNIDYLCTLCVVKSRCPQMKSVSLFGDPVKVEDDGKTCADRLLAWLKEEAPAKK